MPWFVFPAAWKCVLESALFATTSHGCCGSRLQSRATMQQSDRVCACMCACVIDRVLIWVLLWVFRVQRPEMRLCSFSFTLLMGLWCTRYVWYSSGVCPTFSGCCVVIRATCENTYTHTQRHTHTHIRTHARTHTHTHTPGGRGEHSPYRCHRQSRHNAHWRHLKQRC